MKFLELHLAAFGPFTDESLDFVQDLRDEHGVHLIYGPNEAGKSSALRAIECFLFGIPPRTRDSFVHDMPKLRIGARIEAADGQEFVGVRRKGNKKTLRDDQDSDVVQESELNRLLGAVDQRSFRNLFGLDHETLVRGGEEILRGSGNLGQLLFAAGAGFSGLHDLLASMQQDAGALFKAGAKNPIINEALGRLAEIRRGIKESSLSSDTWKTEKAALENTRLELETLQNELDSCTREQHRLQRISDALPIIAQRNELVGRAS